MTTDQADQLLASRQPAVPSPPAMPKPGEVPLVEHHDDSPWRQLTPQEVAALAASATGPGTRIPPAVEASPAIPIVSEKSKIVVKTDTTATKVGGVQPVHIDGGLYALMGGLSAFIACMSTEGAAKHVGPDLLWWLQTMAEVADGVVLSIKMYRSTGYADSKS